MSRRGVLVGSSLALLGLALKRSALAQVAVRRGRDPNTDHALVVVFLRGGADGLNIVVPYAEDDYYRARPSLAIRKPNEFNVLKEDRALDLNGFFGFHSALAPLLPLYHGGKIAIVHAAGSSDATHSHFEAMSTMERGRADRSTGDATGWLARHLLSAGPAHSPLRAVAIGGTMPESLRGAPGALALSSLDDFRLKSSPEFQDALESLYLPSGDEYTRAGNETLKALRALHQLGPDEKSSYPESDLGQGFRQVARLIRADVGLEIACLDRGGWDTHVAQGRGTGILANQLTDLAASTAAFVRDLGPLIERVTVVVQTEFGRRVHENDGQGTDHGAASFMMVLGEGVAPGIHGEWPGLHDLSGPGDLQTMTDYRRVLAEVLEKRLNNSQLAKVFPGLEENPVGVMA